MEAVLSESFLRKYPDFPEHMNSLGRFVYLRTYSRYLEHLKRRETWKETVGRSVTYNINLEIQHKKKYGIPIDMDSLYAEAEELFDSIFNLRQFLSGRTHWVGGTEAADKYVLSNYNCSYASVRKWEDLADIFYLLMVGTGAGFKSRKVFAKEMPPIRTGVSLIHSEYDPVPAHERLETTRVIDLENGYAKIYIADSKEGWIQALRAYLHILTKQEYEHIHTINFNYNSVRPAGERLKTFGGTASGPEPLREMFEGFDRVLKNQIDPTLAPLEPADRPGYYHVRPIHILDMGNFIGYNVVVGGKQAS